MVVGDKEFGVVSIVVSYVLVGGSAWGYSPLEIFLYFSTPRKCEHFLKQIFGILDI
jgi:hypothetical protein